jgi:hypothetical protein
LGKAAPRLPSRVLVDITARKNGIYENLLIRNPE